MLPLVYVLKSLERRKLRTAMTVAGVALAIGLYAAMSAVAETMVGAFSVTGAPDEVVISQAGALNVEFSNVERATLSYVQTLDGVAASGGRPLVSPEIYVRGITRLGSDERDVAIRGVTRIAPRVYGQVRLAKGRWPGPDHGAAVGTALAKRFRLSMGDTLELEGGRFSVVGVLDSAGRVYDQEVWVDLDVLAAETNRTDYSSYTIRTTDVAAAAALVENVNGSRRHPVKAMRARDFYARSGAMALVMAGIGRFIALIIVVGAIFTGMNAMYSSVAGRRQEIGVLRALGYRRWTVLVAFLVESSVLCVGGGVIGILLGLAVGLVPLDLPYMTTDHVRIGAPQLFGALVLAVVVGVLGGLLPAFQASRTKVVDALR